MGDIQVILTDKDMVERNIFCEECPDADLQICLYHVLRTMKREITREKMNITAGERNTVLEIIQKLTYSRSELEYQTLYQQLLDCNLGNVTIYFNKNWHNIHTKWVEGLKYQQMSLSERTTNRLESFFQKLKSVLNQQGNKRHDRFFFWPTSHTAYRERSYGPKNI